MSACRVERPQNGIETIWEAVPLWRRSATRGGITAETGIEAAAAVGSAAVQGSDVTGDRGQCRSRARLGGSRDRDAGDKETAGAGRESAAVLVTGGAEVDVAAAEDIARSV
jgi:hypothetical protein